MKMTIKKRPKFPNPQKPLDNDSIAKAIRESLADIRSSIIMQTNRGVDLEGQPFKPYRRKYLKIRKESGRSTTPNLVWSGQMLKSIFSTLEVKNHKIIGLLRFAPDQLDKALQNHFDFKRPFFGINSLIQKILPQKIKTSIKLKRS